MLDPFDYKEPNCPLCGGKQFYSPDENEPKGRVPVGRIIEKLDEHFCTNDLEGAKKLLSYWLSEAKALCDRQGELSIQNELVGLYRRTAQKEEGLSSVSRCLELLSELELESTVSGATVLLNCATTMKAFGMPNEAIPIYEKTEKVYKELLPDGDARFGGLYNNMALALADLLRFDDAENAFNAALSVMEKTENGEGEAAVTYVNLAHMYESWGRPEKIALCLKKAYILLLTDTLPHDGHYAFICEKCAPSYEYFGKEKTARDLHDTARSIYEGA